jgi:hypothetical protein
MNDYWYSAVKFTCPDGHTYRWVHFWRGSETCPVFHCQVCGKTLIEPD